MAVTRRGRSDINFVHKMIIFDTVFPDITFLLTKLFQANRPIEDRHIEARLPGTDKYLFGVFDGHAGCACAQTLKERLFQYIAISMADCDKLNWIYQRGMSAVDDLLDFLQTSTVDTVSPDLASIHWQSAHRFIQDSLSMYSTESSVSLHTF